MRALYHATAQKRKDILRHCSPDFLQALSEVALNLLKGNIPLSQRQYKTLKSKKKIIRLLGHRKTSLKQKRQALMTQSGGFILPLLAAAIPILGQVIGGAFRR